MIEEDSRIEQLEINSQRLNEGFGFGEGGISYAGRREVAGPEAISAVEAIIESSEILTAVATNKQGEALDDDGCGDGREVGTVYAGEIVKGSSLDRSKVFGGSTAMTVGAKIGLAEAQNYTLSELFAKSMADLDEQGIDYGAHTDEHNSEDPNSVNSGCGAIDKSPIVIANVVKYSDAIRATIEGLGVDTSQLDTVLENFAVYAPTLESQEFSGKEVVNEIVKKGKIVKELCDQHNEAFVVLNAIPGQTINQAAVRDATEGTVQVFGVDVWRMQDLATRLYADNPEKANQAFLGELAYTLGVSATLTAGDLPVYLITKK